MELSVDRYLDDGPTQLVTLSVRSRTTRAHSALSALAPDQQAAVQRVLAHAMDDITAIVQPVIAALPTHTG